MWVGWVHVGKVTKKNYTRAVLFWWESRGPIKAISVWCIYLGRYCFRSQGHRGTALKRPCILTYTILLLSVFFGLIVGFEDGRKEKGKYHGYKVSPLYVVVNKNICS